MPPFLKKVPWGDILLVGLLIAFDISVHPLTAGPDRLVHDPAVYRLADPHYLPGDWYTEMAVKSGIYFFYAPLVNAWRLFHLPEEFWRQLLYLSSLALLYYSLFRVARLFTKSILVVPIMAVLHLLLANGDNQPIWLYGPYLQIDGGLAPRSIGVALSFMALFYLLRGSLTISALTLGLATLVHASNSFIVLTLFFVAWLLQTWLTSKEKLQQRWREVGGQIGRALLVYLLAGGWFAFYVASKSSGGGGQTDFPTEQFIWSWIYFRAPYMALPSVAQYWWIRLFAHVAAIVLGWLLLRSRVEATLKQALNIVTLVGLGSVGYFFLFYLFAFVWPWLPGFQFYSLRVVYFAYFAAYLSIALSLLVVGREVIAEFLTRIGLAAQRFTTAGVVILVIAFLTIVGWQWGGRIRQPKWANLTGSWQRILDNSVVWRPRVPEGARVRPPQNATFQYLSTERQPFLGPPDWNRTIYYLPQIVTFKSFGFSEAGLPEWFERMNDISQGELQRMYDLQVQTGQFKPTELNWRSLYSSLTSEDVVALAEKYRFPLFLTYRDLSYPFEQVTEDENYRLYRLP